jgi:HEAT repeats
MAAAGRIAPRLLGGWPGPIHDLTRHVAARLEPSVVIEVLLVAPFATAVATAVGLYAAERVRVVRSRDRAWERAGRQCDLENVVRTGRLGLTRTLHARADGFTIRSWRGLTPGSARQGLWVAVSPVTDRLRLLMPDGPLRARHAPVQASEDIEIGDRQIDGQLLIAGDPLAVRALLDADARGDLRALTTGWGATPRVGYLAMSGGELRVVTDSAAFVPTLTTLLQLARRLKDESPVEERVAALAASDQLPDVRLASLKALVDERPRHPSTRQALHAALADPHPRLRLAAALTLRTEGREVLSSLARDPELPDDLLARAVSALGVHLPPDDVEGALARALQEEKEDTVGACLRSLAVRGAGHLSSVLRVLAHEIDARALAAAQALGDSGTAEAEEPLVAALAHPSTHVRVAAATSLGRVGTASSVPALRRLELSASMDPLIGRAAREATASIQSRLVGAAHGQLAVAPESGELSLADDARGRMTLKEGA